MSKTEAIPFNAGQASGLSELSGASPLLSNFIPDAAGALRVRPGIETWSGFPAVVPSASPVIGIFPWRQYVIYVCEDRTLWAWLASGLVQALSDATAATKLDGTGRPVWTYDSTRVTVAGGGAPQQWQGVGLSSRLAPAAVLPSGSPLALTHIAYAAQRFIGNANDNSGYLVWTPPGPASHTSWPIVGPYYAEAEASPDSTVAVFANSNEVFAFGASSTQVYTPDPSIAFAVASSMEIGCSAPYSVISTDDGTMSWLDDKRRVVTSAGRGAQVISTPGMTATFNTLANVVDAWGCNVKIGSADLLLWAFPAEKRAFFFDRVTKKWGEWQTTDERGVAVGFLARSYAYWPAQNLHLIGTADGRIMLLSAQALRDDGKQIIALSRTGLIDRGTFTRKSSERVQLQLKRGFTVPGAASPVVEYLFRDDLGAMQPAVRRTLGEGGDYASVVDAWSLGMYRTRQHEIRFTDAGGFILAGATETFITGDA